MVVFCGAGRWSDFKLNVQCINFKQFKMYCLYHTSMADDFSYQANRTGKLDSPANRNERVVSRCSQLLRVEGS
jgi:hypothetical protein